MNSDLVAVISSLISGQFRPRLWHHTSFIWTDVSILQTKSHFANLGLFLENSITLKPFPLSLQTEISKIWQPVCQPWQPNAAD